MPVSQECLETRTKDSKHACKFLGSPTRLEPTGRRGELGFAGTGTGVSTGRRAHSSPLCSAVRSKESNTCVHFLSRKLGSVLDRQQTMTLHVSFWKRKDRENEKDAHL